MCAGRVVRLDGVLQTILGQHDYPAPVAALVAEAVLLTAAIGQTIKLHWKLSLQNSRRWADPPDCDGLFWGQPRLARRQKSGAYASYDADRLAASDRAPFENIGKGMFAVFD